MSCCRAQGGSPGPRAASPPPGFTRCSSVSWSLLESWIKDRSGVEDLDDRFHPITDGFLRTEGPPQLTAGAMPISPASSELRPLGP
eukprot:7027925-Pyramimonas_sp.AAC.1